MNVALLRKVIKAIQQEPRRLFMGNWIYTDDPVAPCKTSACIAGHAVVLSKKERGQSFAATAAVVLANTAAGEWRDYDSIEEEARHLLRLTSRQADRLFLATHWPAKFHIFGEPRTAKEREVEAAIAVKRIGHFIKTKGKE